jgi:hypothetical protein
MSRTADDPIAEDSMLEQADGSIAGKGDASLVSVIIPCYVSLRRLLLYPAKLARRTDSLDPMTTLRLFIADHYVPVKQVDSWLIMPRVSSSSTVPRATDCGDWTLPVGGSPHLKRIALTNY